MDRWEGRCMKLWYTLVRCACVAGQNSESQPSSPIRSSRVQSAILLFSVVWKYSIPPYCVLCTIIVASQHSPPVSHPWLTKHAVAVQPSPNHPIALLRRPGQKNAHAIQFSPGRASSTSAHAPPHGPPWSPLLLDAVYSPNSAQSTSHKTIEC